MKKNLIKSLVLAAVGSFMMVGVASADMLTGGVSFINFDWKAVTSGTDVIGIDLIPNEGLAKGTGDFLVLTGETAQFNDIVFTPFVDISPLWTVTGSYGTFSFDLESISVLDAQTDLISLEGVGTIHATGFEDTVGTWSLTAQEEGNQAFSWSSSTAAAPVPEPATMLLFGTGLIGLAGMARRRKASN